VLVAGHGLDLTDPTVARLVGARNDSLFAGGAVHATVANGQLAFVYKVAAEIGELGDNTAALRSAIRADELSASRSDPRARVRRCSATRAGRVWDHLRAERAPARQRGGRRRVRSVRHRRAQRRHRQPRDLRALEALRIAPQITTDAKVIPRSSLAGSWRSRRA